jgi:hypothetical protein
MTNNFFVTFRAAHCGRPPGQELRAQISNFDMIRTKPSVSVTRLKITSPKRLLQLVGGDIQKGSRVARAKAQYIRGIGLRVVPKPRQDDPGHAEIQSDKVSLDDHACRKKLAMVFQFLS